MRKVSSQLRNECHFFLVDREWIGARENKSRESRSAIDVLIIVIFPTAELLVDLYSSGYDSNIFAWFNEKNIIPM